MADFNACIAFTLQQEGGWSDDAHDPGSSTMEGVTLAAYRAWKGDFELTADDLRNISAADVRLFYQQCYWTPIFGDRLPAGIDLMVYDMAVNAGISGSVSLVESVVGTSVDGKMGPQTLQAVAAGTAITLIDQLASRQGDYYQSLSGFLYFGNGWLARLGRRKAAAIIMANAPPRQSIRARQVARLDVPPQSFWNTA